MWQKTLAGFFCGMLTMTLIPSAIVLISETLTSLMVAVVITIGISAWAGVMTYCYAANTTKQAWQRGALVLAPSLAIYLLALIIRGIP